jgi:RNA polymerase sigma factor (sigma-70 family)
MSTAEAKRRLSDWFRQWRLPLRRFLLGRAGVRAADVDDVAQEVFLRLMRYERAELVEHPQAYLHKIASNVAAEWLMRAAGRTRRDARWSAGDPEGADSPEAMLLRAQSEEHVARALMRLQPRQREVLKLHFAEDLGHAAIAERTGQSLRSVRRHFARGYKKLRQELDPGLLRAFEEGAMSRGSD